MALLSQMEINSFKSLIARAGISPSGISALAHHVTHAKQYFLIIIVILCDYFIQFISNCVPIYICSYVSRRITNSNWHHGWCRGKAERQGRRLIGSGGRRPQGKRKKEKKEKREKEKKERKKKGTIE